MAFGVLNKFLGYTSIMRPKSLSSRTGRQDTYSSTNEMFEYNDNLNMLITKNDIKLFVLRKNQENFMKEVWIKLGFERECVAFLEVETG